MFFDFFFYIFIEQFLEHILESLLIVRRILSIEQTLNFVYSLFFIVFAGSFPVNSNSQKYSVFIQGFASFFKHHCDLLKHTICRLIILEPNWAIRILFNIVDVEKIQDQWNSIILRLFSFRKQGRDQWKKKYLPLFVQLEPLFYNVIEFAPTMKKLQRLWKQSIKWIKLQPLNIVLPQKINSRLDAIYWSIFNIAEWERITSSVRENIHIIQILDAANNAHIIFNDCLIWKFIEDGFVLSNKRSIINTVLTNVGIEFGWNSTLLTYIIQLADAKENTFNVMANSQGWQRDLNILRICGWPDPITFELFTVLGFELSDSCYQEKKVGSSGASSKYKYSNQYVNKEIFCKHWKKYRVKFPL